MSQTAQRRPPRRTRDEQRAEDAKRRADRRMRWIVLTVVGAVLLVLVGVAAMSQGDSGTTTTSNGKKAPVVLPTGAEAVSGAVPVAPEVTPKAGAPRLDIWEDFQCPSCAMTEQAGGEHILELARSGDVQVFWRVTTFLDDRFPGASSLRAAAAWGCAIDAGRGVEYHGQLFAQQPAQEGAGFSDAKLLRIGRDSGITGADYTTFKTCVADARHKGWAQASTAGFHQEAVPGTPAGYLDGIELAPGTLADPAALDAAIAKAQ